MPATSTTAADLRALLRRADLLDLINAEEPPCVSIHIHTQREPNHADANHIRFKNALREVERSLKQGDADVPRDVAEELLAPLREMEKDKRLFSGMLDGLMVFRSPQRLMVRQTPYAVPEFAVVADSFHVKPVIRAVQSADVYRVLCVSADEVALYEGSRFALRPIELHSDVPHNMAEAIGGPSHVAKTTRTTFQPEDSDQRDRQLRRYFRRLDEAIADHHAPHGDHVPLMLAALPEYHALFHDASHNPNLVEHGIKRDPFHDLKPSQLVDLAAEAYQPVVEQRVGRFKSRYGEARSHEQGSDQLEAIAAQAVFGKVQTLALRQDYRVGGRVDPGTGEVQRIPLNDPAIDDLADDIAEYVLRQSGDVLVLEGGQMPTDTGLAAVFRK